MSEKVQISLEIKGCCPEEELLIYLALKERLDEVMEFLELKKGSVEFMKGE